MRLPIFMRKHLNTWEEMCSDEGARLHTNLILFTFFVSGFCIFMMGLNFIIGRGDAIPVAACAPFGWPRGLLGAGGSCGCIPCPSLR